MKQNYRFAPGQLDKKNTWMYNDLNISWVNVPISIYRMYAEAANGGTAKNIPCDLL